MSRKVRTAFLVIFVLLFLISMPALFLYANGYRLGENWSLVKTGGLYVYAGENGAELRLNVVNIKRNLNVFGRGFFVQNLKPGLYRAMVLKEDFYPWEKEFEVREGLVTETSAFLMPIKPILNEISATSSSGIFSEINEYDRVQSLFKDKSDTFSEANSTSTAVVKDRVAIWNEGGILYAKWRGNHNSFPHFFCLNRVCQEKEEVYNFNNPIGHIDFYPGRTDTVLVGLSGEIAAISLDKNPPQYIRMFYKKDGIDFRVDDEERIYIKDGNHIYEVIL